MVERRDESNVATEDESILRFYFGGIFRLTGGRQLVSGIKAKPLGSKPPPHVDPFTGVGGPTDRGEVSSDW